MKIKTSVLLFTVLLSLLLTSTALAAPGTPVGACAPGFELMHFMVHDGEHMHTHIGVNADLNGNGNICMKALPNNMHLHIDNRLPLG